MTAAPIKPVVWLGDSLRTLKTFPAGVQDEVGYALYLAQRRGKHVSAKPLKGLGAGCIGDRVRPSRRYISGGVHGTVWRASICAARLSKKVEARRCAAPQAEVGLLKRRLKLAVEISEAKE